MNEKNEIKKFWQYRYLLSTFVWRDITLRYKYTIIGIGWAIINPLFLTIVLTLAFGKIKAITTNNIPYPVFSFIGILFWNYFTSSLNRVSNCLNFNRSLITKIYFPRIILPVSAMMVGLIDFFIAFIFFLMMLVVNGLFFSITDIVFLLPCLLIVFLTSLSLGLFFSFLNVKYRDTREILPFLTTLLFFLSPIIYPARFIPAEYHYFLYLNPLTGAIETMRSVFITKNVLNWQGFFISLSVSFFLFLLSFYFFKKNEKELADII